MRNYYHTIGYPFLGAPAVVWGNEPWRSALMTILHQFRDAVSVVQGAPPLMLITLDADGTVAIRMWATNTPSQAISIPRNVIAYTWLRPLEPGPIQEAILPIAAGTPVPDWLRG
jgi:hypothetical protein